MEKDEGDPGLVRGFGCGARLRQAQVVELSNRGVSRRPKLAIDGRIRTAYELGRLSLGLGEHLLPPGPEVPAGGSAAERTLEGVAVRADEARQGEGGHDRATLAPANNLSV